MAELAPENNLRMIGEQNGEESRVKLSGRITIDSAPEFRALLLQKLASDCQVLTIDFCDVTYIDTSGLAVLIELLRAAKRLRKTLQLSGLRERPRYVLESTGLLHLFDQVSTPCTG